LKIVIPAAAIIKSNEAFHDPVMRIRRLTRNLVAMKITGVAGISAQD